MSDERIAEILGEWLGTAERPDPQEVVARHPELADELRTRFKAMELVDRLLLGPEEGVMPERLGEYRILREIGRGGMGVVYEAEQEVMRRRVALKVLFPSVTSTSKAVKRFQQEAQAAGRLKHTNIVAVYQLGQELGTWYCAMELVEGRPLADVIAELRKTRKPPRESRLARRALGQSTRKSAPSSWTGATTGTRAYYVRVAEMFAEVAEALQVAHDHHVVHRDIKPGNLLLDAAGHLRIVDFGLARLDEGENAMTRTGDLAGTPLYMSPEQLGLMGAKLDHRTDIYSLGATLYETLALRPPQRGKNLEQIVSRIATRDADPARRWDKSIPKDLETIVCKSMEKDPAKRYRDAEAMARDLRRFAVGDAIAARRIGPLGRTWRKVKRHKVRSGLTAALVLVATGAAILAIDSAGERERLRRLEALRIETNYLALCRRAEEAAVLVPSGHALEAPADPSAVDLFTQAIELAPDRREAYFGRAFARGRTGEQRLADIAAAHERGLPDRTTHLARAIFLTNLGQRVEAEAEERLAQQQSGGSFSDLAFEGRLAAARGDRQGAIRLLSRAISEAPRTSALRQSAFHRRGLLHQKQGAPELAIEDFHAVRAAGDESLQLRVRIAALWQALDRPDRAASAFAQIVDEVSTEPVWLVLVRTCREIAPREWSNQVSSKAVQAFPASAVLRLQRGAALYDQDLLDDAIASARESIRLDPQYGMPHNLIGVALSAKELPDEAIASYRESIRLEPNYAGAHTNLGIELRAKGLLDEAIASHRESIRLKPNYAGSHSNLGVVLSAKGLHDEAIASFRDAIRLKPDIATCHDNLGAALSAKGLRDEATASLREAIRLDPDFASPHYNLGIVLGAKGLTDEAIASYRESIRLNPDYAPAHNSLGSELHAKGLHDEAIASHRESIRLDPDNATAHSNLGVALSAQGRHDDAIASYREAIRLKPDFAVAHSGLGNRLRSKGLLDEAIAAHREAIRVDPVYSGAHNNLGNALVEKGLHDEAITSFRESIRLDPDNAVAHANLGATLHAKGLHDEAIAPCRESIRLDPGHAGVHSNLGLALEAKGLHDEAIASHREAIRLDPNFAVAHTNLGNALRAEGLLDEAIASHREAIRLDPEYAGAHGNLGTALLDEGLLDEALASYRELIRLEPDSGMAHSDLGNALQAMGRPEEAIASCRESIRLDPEYALAHSNLGNALMDKDLLDEALVSYRESIRLDPDFAAAHYNLGNALQAKGLPDQAIASFRKAIRLDPKYADAHYNLGIALRAKGLLDQAIASYREAIRFDPKDAPAHSNLGIVLQEQGQTAEAIASYREAIRLDPKLAATHANLGIALQRLGRHEDAVDAYRKAASLEPANVLFWRQVGHALSESGGYEEAVRVYSDALKLHPRNGALHADRASSLNNLQRFDEGLRDAEEALRLATKPDAHLWYLKAFALMGAEQLDKAMRFLDGLPKTAWSYGGLFQVKGAVLEELERYGEAVEALRRAIDRSDHWAYRRPLIWLLVDCPDPEVRDLKEAQQLLQPIAAQVARFDGGLLAGTLLYRMGRFEAARGHLSQATKRHPRPKGQTHAKLCLAMAEARLGRTVQAHALFREVTAWVEEHEPNDKDFARWRAEAEEVLGIKND